MKKIIIFLIISILFFQFIPLIYAWGNNSYGYNEIDYDYNTDYGTHDWIADKALSILYNDNLESWKWLMERRTIFLIGTESPDNSDVFMILNEITVEGFGDTVNHHIYFNEGGTIFEDDAGLRAKTCGDIANSYINENKYDIASFYLGAMCHYIGDMGMYSHTSRNNISPDYINFDLHHSDIESYTNTRTNDFTNLNEFFQFSSFTIENKAPYEVAKELAWDTYKDEDGNYDAKWLHNNFFSGWKQIYNTRYDDTIIHQEYYNRIEESLNLAIQGCINAIAYELNYNSNINDIGINNWYIYLMIGMGIIGLILSLSRKIKIIV
jgi:hypothetical protein